MTGATKPEHVREYFHSVKYGDLDGAYSSSGSMLEVFDWNGAEWITADEVKEILKKVKNMHHQGHHILLNESIPSHAPV